MMVLTTTRDSTTTVFNPAFCAEIAAARPHGPPPTMSRSNSGSAMSQDNIVKAPAKASGISLRPLWDRRDRFVVDAQGIQARSIRQESIHRDRADPEVLLQLRNLPAAD